MNRRANFSAVVLVLVLEVVGLLVLAVVLSLPMRECNTRWYVLSLGYAPVLLAPVGTFIASRRRGLTLGVFFSNVAIAASIQVLMPVVGCLILGW